MFIFKKAWERHRQHDQSYKMMERLALWRLWEMMQPQAPVIWKMRLDSADFSRPMRHLQHSDNCVVVSQLGYVAVGFDVALDPLSLK